MKASTQIRRILLAVIVTGAPFFAHAGEGGQGSGGGDTCENRIKQIRSDVEEWIQLGNSKALQLPKEISHATYSAEMLRAISQAKIKCVGPGNKGYPVQVEGTPKTCRFESGKKSSRITCEIKKFLALSESDQYVLIHHEFAGIAKIEKPTRDDSKYTVSNQISAHLKETVVKKLVVGRSGKSVSTYDDIPDFSNVLSQPMTALSGDSKITREAVKGLEFVNGNYQNGKRVDALDEMLPFCTVRADGVVRFSGTSPSRGDSDADYEFGILQMYTSRVVDMDKVGKPARNWTNAILMDQHGNIVTLACSKVSKTLFLPMTIAEVQSAMGEEFLFDNISTKRLISAKTFDRLSPGQYSVTPADVLGLNKTNLQIDLPSGQLLKNPTATEDNTFRYSLQAGRFVTWDKIDLRKPYVSIYVTANPGEDLDQTWFNPGQLKINSAEVSASIENRLRNTALVRTGGSLIIRGISVDGHKVDVYFSSPTPNPPTYEMIQQTTGLMPTWMVH